MSVTNTDLTGTKFPDEIDNWDRWLDPTLQTIAAIQKYQSLYSLQKFEEANEVIQNTPVLKRIIVNAESMNKLQDAIIAMERFYFSDFQAYLQNIIQYKGNYLATKKYTKYSVVTYMSHNTQQAYLCIIPDCPIGTPPTDLSCWIPWTARGEKGESGLGLTPRGIWDEYADYYKDDMVSWNNKLWAALSDNMGREPSIAYGDIWFPLLEFSSDMLCVIDEVTNNRYHMGMKDGYVWYCQEGDKTEANKIYVAKKSDLDNKIRCIRNVTLEPAKWTNLTYTLSDPSVSADYVPAVNYAKDSILTASKAGITVESFNGYLLLSACRLPETDITIDSIILTKV